MRADDESQLVTAAAPNRANAPNSNTLGIAFMLLAILLFSLNDAMGKWLVSTYSVGQLLLIRSIAALVVLAPLIWRSGWASVVKLEKPWLMALRVALTTAEVSAFYLAVVYLPLADVITYWMAAPIYVAALSPLLLGEHVGWRRWTAIFVGFLGVLIALEPSSATLSLPALISLCGSLFFALMMIAGRALRGAPDIAMVFWPTVGAGLAGLATVPFAWTSPPTLDLSLLALLGVVALAAHFFTNRSLKLADAATVTPYQYTLLVWAVTFGWVFFGETPRPAVLVGAAFIVASGLYIFFREQQLGRRPSATPVDGPG